MLLNFVIVGAPKAGTTSLFRMDQEAIRTIENEYGWNKIASSYIEMIGR